MSARTARKVSTIRVIAPSEDITPIMAFSRVLLEPEDAPLLLLAPLDPSPESALLLVLPPVTGKVDRT